jgi:Uncharacterized protein conserved in bacteria
MSDKINKKAKSAAENYKITAEEKAAVPKEKNEKAADKRTSGKKTVDRDKKKNSRDKKRASLFNNKTFVLIFSIIVAIVCWAAVAFSSSTEIETVIKDVPVNLTTGATYMSYGLEVMDSEVKLVDVTVRGPRAVVGKLDASSVTVSPVFTGVNAARTYELTLTSSKVNPLENFEIVYVSPRTISLTFDIPSVRKFTIDTSEITATAAEGYLIDKITTDPPEVSITGSEDDVGQISRVAVRHTFDHELSSNERLNNLELYVYDEHGQEMSKEKLRMSVTTVDVTVPVYKLGTIQIDIGFTNVPDGFDIKSLGYVLSVTEIGVAGVESILDNLRQPWIVGYVDLTTFEIGKEYEFVIELPSGLVNRGSNTVTVTFPKEDISTKKINVTDIRIENEPLNYEVNVLTSMISDVTVIGQTRDVEELLPTSVIAIVDFSQISISSGQYSVAVKFIITANNTTWVAGSYTVIVEVKTI